MNTATGILGKTAAKDTQKDATKMVIKDPTKDAAKIMGKDPMKNVVKDDPKKMIMKDPAKDPKNDQKVIDPKKSKEIARKAEEQKKLEALKKVEDQKKFEALKKAEAAKKTESVKVDSMKQKVTDQVKMDQTLKKPTKDDMVKKVDIDPKKVMVPTGDPKKMQTPVIDPKKQQTVDPSKIKTTQAVTTVKDEKMQKEKKDLMKKAEQYTFPDTIEDSKFDSPRRTTTRDKGAKTMAGDLNAQYPLKQEKKMDVSTPKVNVQTNKLKDIEIPKIGKKQTATLDKRKTEQKKVESLQPKSPTKPGEKKGTITVPMKKEEEKKGKKLPIDQQQRPDKIPIGLIDKQRVPLPQADQLKEKTKIPNKKIESPTISPKLNKDLQPPQRIHTQVPEDAEELIEQYVYMESDRSVRKELTNYRKDIMEQLELFREAQKKQIQTHFKQLELNRGGYGHPAYDNMHSQMAGNPHDPIGINQYLLNPEDAYRMGLPPPFKPQAPEDYQPASPSSPAMRADREEKPMDSVPHNGDIEGYIPGDPAANAPQYKPPETIEELRRQEVDPRHMIEKPGIHVSGGKPGMSPRSKKNFIAMNKMHTTAYDSFYVNKERSGKLKTKIVNADSYSPPKTKKISAQKSNEQK